MIFFLGQSVDSFAMRMRGRKLLCHTANVGL